jgi:streptogramin lyase
LVTFLVATSVHAVELRPGDLIVTRAHWPDRPAAVLRVDPLTGAETVVALLDERDTTPYGVAVDAHRELFVVEWSLWDPTVGGAIGENDIVHIDPVTGSQRVVVSFPDPYGAPPVTPYGIVIDDRGDLLVTDIWGAIIRVDPATGAVTVISSGFPPIQPTGIAIGADGDLFVLSRDMILRIDPATGERTPIAQGQGLFTSITRDAQGDLLVTADGPLPPPRICWGGSKDGNPCAHNGECPDGFCRRMQEDDSILRVDPVTGTQSLVSSTGSRSSLGIAVDAYGDIFVIQDSRDPIIRVDPETGAREAVAPGDFHHAIAIVPGFEIALDVKPGSDANPINVSSMGVIPVAILGSDAFDAADVDVTTLAFGPDGAAPKHRRGGHEEDVNDDGLTDLVSHFSTQAAGIAPGDIKACVTGETLSGIPFEGCDEITTGPACGIGFEFAFLLFPPLVRVHGRGRRQIRHGVHRA